MVQCKVGTFLYYGRAVEPAILIALNNISSSEQATPTNPTIKDLSRLCDFLATYPNAITGAGTMQLKIESDTLYLSVANSQSRYTGHLISNHPKICTTTLPKMDQYTPSVWS